MPRAFFPIRRWTLWLACCAILLNALAPAVSHAMAARAVYLPGSDICSASHVAHPADRPQHAGMLEDCAYCLVHAGSFALPPPHRTAPGLRAGQALRPRPVYRAPAPLLALIAAPPRGPPVSA